MPLHTFRLIYARFQLFGKSHLPLSSSLRRPLGPLAPNKQGQFPNPTSITWEITWITRLWSELSLRRSRGRQSVRTLTLSHSLSLLPLSRSLGGRTLSSGLSSWLSKYYPKLPAVPITNSSALPWLLLEKTESGFSPLERGNRTDLESSDRSVNWCFSSTVLISGGFSSLQDNNAERKETIDDDRDKETAIAKRKLNEDSSDQRKRQRARRGKCRND